MSSAPQPPSRPTLEDLLRLKRAERPSPEFWAEFDRGLRQKQLAALMRQPKGWARMRPVFARGMRWAVPATAAAAVALVVVQIPIGTASRPAAVEVASQKIAPSVIESSTVVQSQPVSSVAVAPRETVTASPRHEQIMVASLPVPTEEIVPASQGGNRSLPWSAATLSRDSVDFRSNQTLAVKAAASPVARPRSSWTSRFSEMVQEIGSAPATDRMVQLASLNFPVSTDPVFSPGDRGTVAASTPAARPPAERDFRDLESRFGVTGSSLSIKF